MTSQPHQSSKPLAVLGIPVFAGGESAEDQSPRMDGGEKEKRATAGFISYDLCTELNDACWRLTGDGGSVFL